MLLSAGFLPPGGKFAALFRTAVRNKIYKKKRLRWNLVSRKSHKQCAAPLMLIGRWSFFFSFKHSADNQWVFWALVEFCSSSAHSQHPRLLYFTRNRESHVSTGILRAWYCTQFSVQESLCLTLASSIYAFKASVFQVYNISCYGAVSVENSSLQEV